MTKVVFSFIASILLLSGFSVWAIEKIDINTATSEQLEILTGIGPKYAQSIINARPFNSLDDLLKVKGIGEKTLQDIKNQGLVCINCQEDETPIEINKTENHSDVSGIFINEILPNPEGDDETNEWIELYNSNNIEIDISGWKIRDIKGTLKTFVIPNHTIIKSLGYLVFERPDTKIMLNNEQDGIDLIDVNLNIIDSVVFSNAPLGLSYNKTQNSWVWSATKTPANKNIITGSSSKNNSLDLPKSQKNANNINDKAGLADISQVVHNQDINMQNPWFLFFTALAIAVVSVIILLLIKSKSNNVRT